MSSLMPEYTDDSQIIPRSSSVVVKRLPASRPGKGKAAMYIGLSGTTNQTSDALQRHTGPPNTVVWRKGAMSKRFDGKDETSLQKQPATVRPSVLAPFSLLRCSRAPP